MVLPRGLTMILLYLLGSMFLLCSISSPVESESDDEEALPPTPLDPTTIRAKLLLANLQGNILQDHGRPLASHVFIQFGDNYWYSRLFVALLSRGVTNARQELDPERKGLFKSVLFAASGYRKLNLKETKIPVRSLEPSQRTTLLDCSFVINRINKRFVWECRT